MCWYLLINKLYAYITAKNIFKTDLHWFIKKSSSNIVKKLINKVNKIVNIVNKIVNKIKTNKAK